MKRWIKEQNTRLLRRMPKGILGEKHREEETRGPFVTTRRKFILAHIILSYLAGAGFVGLEVFAYRPNHYSDPELRRGAFYVFAVSPITAPILLVGYPIGAAIHHYWPRPLWCVVALAYIFVESAALILILDSA